MSTTTLTLSGTPGVPSTFVAKTVAPDVVGTTKTLANLMLSVQEVTTAGVSFTLNSKLQQLCLLARGGEIQFKLDSAANTEYWALSDATRQDFNMPDLAGQTVYFDAASTLNVQIIQVLRET